MNSRLPVLALLILSIPFSHAQSPGDIARESYVDSIASLRDQINSAQLEQGKLEADRLDASNYFARANVPNFNFARYEAQMRSLNNQIEAERSLIASLKAQLKAAREAARHEGVQHPTTNAVEAGSTAEIDRRYLDRIATLRSQVNDAQQELAKLRGRPSTWPNEFARTVASVPFWEMQVTADELKEEIEEQRNLIASLQAQLEEMREAARHAGAPHATD